LRIVSIGQIEILIELKGRLNKKQIFAHKNKKDGNKGIRGHECKQCGWW
jgi:hypothetical protein